MEIPMTTGTEAVDQLLPQECPTFKTTLYHLEDVTATGEGLRGALNNEYLHDSGCGTALPYTRPSSARRLTFLRVASSYC
jgi:hypothetical protein